MLGQQFEASFQIFAVVRGQFKILIQSTHYDQQMQAIAKERLLFGQRFTEGGGVYLQVTWRTRHQMKLYDRDGQTIQNTLPVLAQIQTAQDDLSDQFGGTHHISKTMIETTL
jgi:hypothetical protein